MRATRRTRPQLAERCHDVFLKAQGWSVPQIARRLDRNEPTMRTWLKAYRTAGLTGLYNTPQSGRPATLGQRVSAQLEPRFAHSPTHCGSRDEGWTVALLREDLAQPPEAARAATVRRQLHAGAWVYTRFATTVPRNAPTAEQQKPGGQQLWPPSGATKRTSR